MMNSHDAYLILNAIPHIGPVTLRRLFDALGEDPLAILQAPRERLLQVEGVGSKMVDTLLRWQEHFDLEREKGLLQRHGAAFTTVADADYPRLLRETYDPPIGLYTLGKLLAREPCVAIIGSRRTTLYGLRVAAEFARGLARRGICVVSGLARGIDTAAHEGALDAGGRTVAVLGCGCDIIYPPENLQLFRRIAKDGAVVSEFPFGRKADRQTFPMRNRVVSGMCRGVIVVETDVAGGSMITAKFAAEQGRQVFAVPGRIDQPSSAGCHQLIRDGAVLVTSVDDIISELSYDDLLPAAPARETTGDAGDDAADPLPPEQQGLVEYLKDGSQLSLDELVQLTGQNVSSVSAGLLLLELKGRLRKRADGRFEMR